MAALFPGWRCTIRLDRSHKLAYVPGLSALAIIASVPSAEAAPLPTGTSYKPTAAQIKEYLSLPRHNRSKESNTIPNDGSNEAPSKLLPLEDPSSKSPSGGGGPSTLAAPGAGYPRRYFVDTAGGWATGRAAAQSFYLSGLANNTTFDAINQDASGGWRWGYAYNNINYCGWVKVDNVTPKDGTPAAHCQDDATFPKNEFKVRDFAGLINCDKCGNGTPIKLDENATAYRNVRPWSSSHSATDAALSYKAGDSVNWRYVTPDNQWVLVSDGNIPSGSNWGFIPRSAFPGSSKNDLCQGKTPFQPGCGHSDWAMTCET